MKKILAICLVASSSFGSLALIPEPVQVSQRTGVLALREEASISYADGLSQVPAQFLATQLRVATDFEWPVEEGTNGTIIFQIEENDALGEEGYLLKVDNSISISAPQSAGLFYGAQTLRQLLPPEIYSTHKVSKEWTIPKVEIRDFPRFGWRGLMLDASRHFMPKEDVMRFVDIMSTLKLNTFHWHLTDDQEWRIEIKKYPKLTEVGAFREKALLEKSRGKKRKPRTYDNRPHDGFYTQADIREVVAYAAARHIRVVPEIDMPGHMQAAIAAYPGLGCTNAPGVEPGKDWGCVLNVEDSTVAFCKDVLSEVLELFPSEFIHVGGDEVNTEEWEANPRMHELLKQRNLQDMGQMQGWFMHQIDDFLVSRHRRMVVWDWEGIVNGDFPRSTVVMWWHGRPADGFREIPGEMVREGHDLVNAANPYFYFDYYQSRNRAGEPEAIGNFLPLEKVYRADPWIPELKGEGKGHILGVQGQIWTEFIHNLEEVEYMEFPRALALSEVGWSPANREKEYSGFVRRVETQQRRFDAAGVNYRDVDKK